MSYKFAIVNINYEDYASGRVLYNQKGTTSYPARLISEIFGRCIEQLERQGIYPPYSIYDPLCGGAYAMTILGFLHGDQISKILVSDIDETVVEFANKNLSLLTVEGLENRLKQLNGYLEEYGKESHKEALYSALRLQNIIKQLPHTIQTLCAQADALKSDSMVNNQKYDMVITDVPYGEIVDWMTEDGEHVITLLLQNLLSSLSNHSIVAISSRKKTTIAHEKYKRVDKFQIGKRQVVLLRPILE